MASAHAMVGAGGFAALAMLDEEEKGQKNNSKKKGKKATQPANQLSSALEVGDPFLNANNNAASPWSVMVSGASGVPQEFSLAFLKDFKKPKCPRKPAALKASEKELVVEKYKEARKTEKKERAKEAKERAKLAAATGQPAPAPAPAPKAKPAAKRPASAPAAPSLTMAEVEAQMRAAAPAPAPAPSAEDEDEDYKQMLEMIRQSTGLNLTFVAGGSSMITTEPAPGPSAWAQGAPPIAEQATWQQQEQPQMMEQQWQQQEWQPPAATPRTQQFWDDAPVGVGPEDYADDAIDDAQPVEEEQWATVGNPEAQKGKKKKKKKKKKVDNAGNFAVLQKLAAASGGGDDSDDEGAKPSAINIGLSVSQLSAPRKDKSHAEGPWVVELTLSSGQIHTIGLDFLKAARLDDLNAGKLELKYAEKDRALHKYKELRKAEKKQRAKEAKETAKLAAEAGPEPQLAPTLVSAMRPPAGAPGMQKPVLRLEGLGEAPSEEGLVEVLPGISFTPPASAAAAANGLSVDPATPNQMTWRRQLPDGRVQTITTTATPADAQNWREQVASMQQKPPPQALRQQTGLTPKRSASWAIRVRWADGGSCSETDQYNAPASFVAFGPIKSAVFKPGKRHGWIDYVDETAAFVGRVCAQMDGQMVCGRRVRVEPIENEAQKQQWQAHKGQPRNYNPAAPPTPKQETSPMPDKTREQLQAAQAHKEKMRAGPTVDLAAARDARAATPIESAPSPSSKPAEASSGGAEAAPEGGEEFWKEYTLDLHAKGSYVPRHLRKYLPTPTASG